MYEEKISMHLSVSSEHYIQGCFVSVKSNCMSLTFIHIFIQ